MNITLDIIKDLESEANGAFYLADADTFANNIQAFQQGLEQYPRAFIAYSYKTNYLPALCKLANEHNCFAEVVSPMEYDMAIRSGVSPERIIVNGPYHEDAAIENYLLNNSVLNLDSWYQAAAVKKAAQRYPERNFRIGIRFSFASPDSGDSRFGFKEEEQEIKRLRRELSEPNVSIVSLHCHFRSRGRTLESYRYRLKKLIGIYRTHFSDCPIEILDTGGGFFANMPETLKKQFNDRHIPSLYEYGSELARTMLEAFGNTDTMKLVVEPGTGLVSDCCSLYARVIDIKTQEDGFYALLNASVQNIKPGRSPVNLPVEIHSVSQQPVSGKFTLTGYTCMEDDILGSDYQISAGIGDYVVIKNAGAYSIVFKPPFIRPQLPVYLLQRGKITLAKQRESVEHILRTFVM